MPSIYVAHTESLSRASMLADRPYNQSGSNSNIGGGPPIRCPPVRFRRSFAPGRRHFGCNTRNASKSSAAFHGRYLRNAEQFDRSRS